MGIENIKKKIEEEKIKIFGMLFGKESLVNHPEVIFRLVLSYRALDQTVEMLNKEDDSTTQSVASLFLLCHFYLLAVRRLYNSPSSYILLLPFRC